MWKARKSGYKSFDTVEKNGAKSCGCLKATIPLKVYSALKVHVLRAEKSRP